MTLDVKVKKIMKSNVESENNLAFGSVTIGPIVTEFTLWNSKNGRFVKLGGPSRCYKDKEGHENYADRTYVDDIETKNRIRDAISKAYDSECS